MFYCFKGRLQLLMYILTFWAATFLKFDWTEYLTLFGLAMLLMEYKPGFQFKKVFKNAKFGQCGPHLLWADTLCRSDCNLSLSYTCIFGKPSSIVQQEHVNTKINKQYSWNMWRNMWLYQLSPPPPIQPFKKITQVLNSMPF